MRLWLWRAVPLVAGLAIVFAAWFKVAWTGGEVLQRDLDYPLYLEDMFGDFFPLLAPDGRSAIGHLNLAPIFAVAIPLARFLGATSGDTVKALMVGQSLLAFISMYAAFLTFVGGSSSAATRTGALVAGIFYALNPWAVARVEHLGLLFGYALIPAVLSMALEALRRASGRLAVMTGLTLVVLAASLHYLLLAAGLLLALCVGMALLGHPRLRLGATARLVGLSAATFLSVEMFFIAPVAASIWLERGLPPGLAATETDLAVGSTGTSWIDAAGMVSNRQWHRQMRPPDQPEMAWAPVGLVPLGALAWGLVRWRERRRQSFALSLLAAAVIGWMVWAEAEQARSVMEALIAKVPFGRAFREPDKLVGLLALSYAWGVGLVTESGTKAVTGQATRFSWERIAGVAAVGLLGLALTSYMVPAVRYFLWKGEVSNWVPFELPDGYRNLLDDARRDAPAAGRTAMFERDERVPLWDSRRVLRQPLARAMGGESLIGPRHSSGALFLALAELLPASRLKDALVYAGVGRVIFATDTEEGKRLEEQVAASGLFEPVARTSVGTIYQLGGSPEPLARAATGWVAVTGLSPTTYSEPESPMAPIVMDAAHGRCSPALLRVPARLGPVTDPIAVRFFCLPAGQFVRLRPGGAGETGWQYADGSPAGFNRWLAALKREKLPVSDLSYGMGFAWVGNDAIDGARSVEFALPEAASGTITLYLRALVGDGVAALRVEIADGSGSAGAAARLARDGHPRFEWIPVASWSGGDGRDRRLVVRAEPGFAAVNLAAVVPKAVEEGLPALAGGEPAVPPRVELRRESRTSLRGTVDGADGSFLLMVNENFDPGWRAFYPGGVARPIPVGLTQMGFLVSQRGSFDLTIGFVPQTAENAGVGLSLAALAGALGYLLWPGMRHYFGRAASRPLVRGQD